MDTLTPESSPASARAFCSSAKSSLDSAVSASMVMVKMSSIMDCVMSRMSTLASPRTRVTPATMPGRFLPRTVMTIREDEISAMGNPFAWLRRARGAPLRYSVHHCTCLAPKGVCLLRRYTSATWVKARRGACSLRLATPPCTKTVNLLWDARRRGTIAKFVVLVGNQDALCADR